MKFKFKYFFFSAIHSIIVSFALGQTAISPDSTNFISPVEIPIGLAGNFGELRPGHFHAGLDIRTQGKEGLKVKVIGDGYISRVGISLYGYGKVVYVTHSNGYTSVYAHLQRFYPQLQEWVKNYQYTNKVYELDVKIDSGLFNIKQGNRVGWSGNTGGSAGPHLHFEIRNTQSEKPINPLHFHIPVKDNLRPTIHYLGIYPLSTTSYVAGKNEYKLYKLEKNSNNYQLAGNHIPKVYGKIGFGIEARDKTTGSPFRCGVYSIELSKNNTTVFKQQMDSLSFENTRQINAHTHFYEWKKNKRRIQRSWLLPGNKLGIYPQQINSGQLFFLDSSVYAMNYKVFDFSGNKTELNFKVKSNPKEGVITELAPPTQILKFGESNSYVTTDLKIDFPSTCLYDETKLYISKQEPIGRCVTPRYHINSIYEPLNDYMTIKINVAHIDTNLRNKLTVVSLTPTSKFLASEGGKIESNWIVAKSRSFGPYTVMLDTIAPKLSPLKSINGLTFKGGETIRFRVSDNLSGVSSYQAWLDNEWILVEYERNKKTAFLQLDRVKANGTKRILKVEISDAVGNAKSIAYNIIY
jgi:hypothetical protein